MIPTINASLITCQMAIAHGYLGPLSRDFLQVAEPHATFLKMRKPLLQLDEEFLAVRKTHEQLLADALLLRFKTPCFDGVLSCAPPMTSAALNFANHLPENICPASYCVDVAQQIAYLVLHCAQLALSLLRMFLERFEGA